MLNGGGEVFACEKFVGISTAVYMDHAADYVSALARLANIGHDMQAKAMRSWPCRLELNSIYKVFTSGIYTRPSDRTDVRVEEGH